MKGLPKSFGTKVFGKEEKPTVKAYGRTLAARCPTVAFRRRHLEERTRRKISILLVCCILIKKNLRKNTEILHSASLHSE